MFSDQCAMRILFSVRLLFAVCPLSIRGARFQSWWRTRWHRYADLCGAMKPYVGRCMHSKKMLSMYSEHNQKTRISLRVGLVKFFFHWFSFPLYFSQGKIPWIRFGRMQWVWCSFFDAEANNNATRKKNQTKGNAKHSLARLQTMPFSNANECSALSRNDWVNVWVCVCE